MAIFDMNFETADRVYNAAWWIAILGAALTFIAISATFFSDSIRDRYRKAEIANINAETGRAHERAAKLELEAEQERGARLDIERALSPRILTRAQTDIIYTAMSKVRIEVVFTVPDEREAINYARYFDVAIDPARNRIGTRNVPNDGSPIRGLRLSGNRSNAQPLADAFRSANVEFTYSPNDTAGPAELFFGLKPFYQPQPLHGESH